MRVRRIKGYLSGLDERLDVVLLLQRGLLLGEVGHLVRERTKKRRVRKVSNASSLLWHLSGKLRVVLLEGLVRVHLRLQESRRLQMWRKGRRGRRRGRG